MSNIQAPPNKTIDLDFNINDFKDSQNDESKSESVRQIGEKTANKDILSLEYSHLLANKEEIDQFRPFSIIRVTTSNSITLVVIKPQNDNVKIFRYDAQYRLTNYSKYFEIIELPNKFVVDNATVNSIFLSPSGLFGAIGFDNKKILVLYTIIT